MKALRRKLVALIEGAPPRERMIAAVAPTIFAVLILGMWVLPNYFRAAQARRESVRLDMTSGDHLLKRSQLVALERDLAAMRADRNLRCREVSELGADRLIDGIARPVDGRGVRNQGIRLGSPERLAKDATRPVELLRRTVTIEMVGSFDAVFSVLDTADRLDQLVVPTRVELAANRGSPEEDIVLRASMELQQFFKPPEGGR